jgi:uncharacterized protein
MFGLSISKVLFTVVIVAAVVYGWKWLNRVQARQNQAARRVHEEAPRPRPAVEAVDMVQCAACGDYVPAKGARRCGRADCPYPG